MRRNRFWFSQVSFLLAGVALMAVISITFLWYGAAHPPRIISKIVQHTTCGQPVLMRAEDYDRWGSTRDDDVDLAWLDFCDPVRLIRRDGREEVWVWVSVEVVGQVFPYHGWGYPWNDVLTPIPSDFREPRNPWWSPGLGIRIMPHERGYTGGAGYTCPHNEAQRGVDLFYADPAGFQIPVNTTHSGWICIQFDEEYSLPTALILTLLPERARITQWADKRLVVHSVVEPAIPAVTESRFCEYVYETHPSSIHAGEACDIVNP